MRAHVSGCSGITVRQEELPLFAEPSFDDVLRRRAITSLTVQFNPRLKKSWRVMIPPYHAPRRLILPPICERAPGFVKDACIDWALLPPRSRAALPRKQELEKIIWNFFKEQGNHSIALRKVNPDSSSFLSKGKLYDLDEVADTINKKVFNGSLHYRIRWGSPGSAMSYQTTALSPDGKPYNLVTIAGIYNLETIPRFAIEAIVHHEMLHIAIPAYKKNDRRVVHGSEFKKAEKTFVHFAPWRAWENSVLRTLLRQERKRLRRTPEAASNHRRG